MKILSVITTIIIIGYVFCKAEGQIFHITLSTSLELDLNDIPDKKIPSNTELYFSFQKDTKPILIHLTLPEEVQKDDFSLRYYGFEKEPSDMDIYNAKDYTENELYEEVDFEGNGKEFIFLMDNEIPYITLLFSNSIDLTSFKIMVENYEKDKEEDDKQKENIYDMNIYNVEYLTNYDIKVKQTSDFYYFGVNSTKEHVGDLVLNIIVPHGIEAHFHVYGFPLKTGEIEEFYTLNQTEDQLAIDILKTKEEETSDTYRYLFTLDEEKKYFLIFVSMRTPIENIKINVREKEEGEEEEKEEEKKTNVYYVTNSTEYQIDQEYLKANLEQYSFYLLSSNLHYGNISIQFKVKKGVSKQSFELKGYKKKDKSFMDDEGRLDLNIKFNQTLEQDEYDIHEYNFELEEELYFLIAILIKEDLDYLSVYLPEPTEPDTTEPDSTDPEPISHNYLYNLSYNTEYKLDKKDFPQEIIPANDNFYFLMKNSGKTNIIKLSTGLEEDGEFEVFTRGYGDKPSNESIYNNELYYKMDLKEKVLENNNDIFVYYVNIHITVPYFSILVIPKKNLNKFSIYVSNEEVKYYLFDYVSKYRITTTSTIYKNVLFPKENDNYGEYLLNVLLPHDDSDKKFFNIYGFELNNSTSKMEDSKEMEVQLIEKYFNEDSLNDVYHYSFTLSEDNKYYVIAIQILENVDNLKYFFYFKKKRYNVKYSTEYEIQKKYLHNCSEYFNTFLSTEPHVGDNYIKLKVKKGLTEEAFTFEGIGKKEFNGTDDTNADGLEIKYKDLIQGDDEYDILQYHFTSNESSAYFVINMVVNNNTVDYLAISFDKSERNKTKPDEQEKPEDPEPEKEPDNSKSTESESGGPLSPIVLAIIIVASLLVVLIVIYFVCRKLGCLTKNDVTSKDIETVDQIIV